MQPRRRLPLRGSRNGIPRGCRQRLTFRSGTAACKVRGRTTMAVFRDVTGRRGAAVKLASVMGGIAATAALGVFLVSVFPAPWTRRGTVAPEPAPPPRAGVTAPSRPLEARAREAEYRKEEQRLRALLAQAQAAQHRRRAAPSSEPVLAAFVVNWDPASLRSLQQHADQLTHVMPE